MTERPRLGAATRVLGVIGDPVDHSRSPAMHNAALAACGLDWVYVAFPVPRGRGVAAVRAINDLGLAGLNVTMPHKADAARACDELSADAEVLDSANTVVPRDGRLVGHSTDGEGFLRALGDEGVAVDGRVVLVVGAGGAARAIVRALGLAGARVTVAARRPDAAEAVAALAPDGVATSLEAMQVGSFDVIVNATPVGMYDDEVPIDTDALHAGQFVYDTIYAVETPLRRAAVARGARAAGGLGMLVHQGAMAFQLFTGREPILDVMRDAAAAT